jgi:rhodanese-related sulfurtransferase
MKTKMIRAIVCVLLLAAAGIAYDQSRPRGALISQQDVLQGIQNHQDMRLIDVRTPEEFDTGHVPGAINIPYAELRARLEEIRPHHDTGLILYCETGRRANMAAKTLRKAGLNHIRHLEGDMSAWRQSNLPIEK